MGFFKKLQALSDRQAEKALNYRNKVLTKHEEKVKKNLDIFMSAASSEKEKSLALSTLRMGGVSTPMAKVDYLGGHYKMPRQKEDIWVVVLPVGILVDRMNSIITFDEIESVEFKTESEIHKDVTLTRMIAFGAYALAMKKKKKVVTNFMVLHCKKDGMPYSMVFAGEGTTKLYPSIFDGKLRVAK